MADSPLAKKLKLKPGARAALVNPPRSYAVGLGPLPADESLTDRLQGTFDWIQVFVKDRAELERTLPRVVKALEPTGLLWLSFPKGSSGIQTDLTRDAGWDIVDQTTLKWITLVSVNEVWSAFALRPLKPGEKKTSRFSRS